jgi:SAM-dependent methyltransferase
MSEAPADSWATGLAYEGYMGRWSRPLARAFLEWLRAKPSSHWLEVGCGTGSLTSAICDLCQPASIVACDPSEAFVEYARSNSADGRASFVVAGAEALPARDGGFDAIVSGLVLNFIPDIVPALAGMRERVRPGGTVGAYVWDYAGGVEFLRYFWEAVVALDPDAASLDESRRFGVWQPPHLASVFHSAGFADAKVDRLTIATDFSDFDDLWNPFLGGTGPAPSYVASLDPPRRAMLRERLRLQLPFAADGRIRLSARASVVRAVTS